MAAFMLQSLVLRGSVRQDVLGYLRLGRGKPASGQVPGIANSWQPLPGTRPTNPKEAPSVVDTTKGACPGAGRSRRHAGSPCCRLAARIILAAPVTGRQERSR
jgi:hypothetical protein